MGYASFMRERDAAQLGSRSHSTSNLVSLLIPHVLITTKRSENTLKTQLTGLLAQLMNMFHRTWRV